MDVQCFRKDIALLDISSLGCRNMQQYNHYLFYEGETPFPLAYYVLLYFKPAYCIRPYIGIAYVLQSLTNIDNVTALYSK